MTSDFYLRKTTFWGVTDVLGQGWETRGLGVVPFGLGDNEGHVGKLSRYLVDEISGHL